MTPRAPHLRPRPRSLRSGAFFVLVPGVIALGLLGLAPLVSASTGALPGAAGQGRLAAQEPDTLRAPRDQEPDRRERRDQDEVASDTVPGDTLGPPPPTFPTLAPLGPASWTRGVWEWDRQALLRFPDLSLLQLLERIPGVVPIQAAIAGQPESAAFFGATVGAIRYVLDGFELDPLVSPTFDASRLSLLALDRVRVERRVTGATVHLTTLSPDHPRARSIIEAGTGDFSTQIFRGMFLAPRLLGGPLALGFERLSTSGGVPGSGNHNVGWVKWGWIRDSVGVQLEYRQSSTERTGVGEPLNGGRVDWVVRGRGARGPVTGELYVGASSVDDEMGSEELGVTRVREGVPHGGARLRAALDAPVPLEARTALRLRDHPRLPFGELEVGVRAQPLPFLAVEAEGVQGWWSQGEPTGRWGVRAEAGPALGLTAFAELVRGGPPLGGGVEVQALSPDSGHVRAGPDGLRVGVQARWGGLAVAAAAIGTRADSLYGFGLPLEPSFPRLDGGEARGVEVLARLPTLWDPFSIQGWYVGMDDPAGWLYLPRHHWRAALVYHHLPLPSGNLEVFGRLEHVFRGRMSVPASVDTTAAAPEPFGVTDVGAYRATNLELTIRVLSLRAFLRWENMMNRQDQQDLPIYSHPGQHILYGVKWEFLN